MVAAPGAAKEAAVSTEIPAGQSKSVRLRNLPQGTVLTIAIETSGRLLQSRKIAWMRSISTGFTT